MTRLTLVEGAARAAFHDEEVARARDLVRRLDDLLRAPDHAENPSRDPRALPHEELPGPLPFSVSLTTRQVLGLAEDVDLRAQLLEWSVENMLDGAETHRRARTLHGVAAELRGLASRVVEEWTPKGSP